jgi:thimet oligopeptidase
MHEFGHVLHCALSDVDYVVHAGLNVKIDFVEAPSRMLEEWARREQPLALFGKVCPGCPQLTREEILGLQAAQRYGRGIGNAREWLLSVYDMALSMGPEPPLEVWKRLEAATPLGHVPGTMFPASFGHISSGMTAGYYAYLWSEALALEMLAPFGPDMLDPDIGRRLRASVLSQGAQREEIDLVRDFLGREPTRAMLFEELANQQ